MTQPNTLFYGDNLPILDPLKEVLAATELVESGFSDYEEQTLRLTGGDWEQTHERLVRQVAKRRRDGLCNSFTFPCTAHKRLNGFLAVPGHFGEVCIGQLAEFLLLGHLAAK